LQEDPDHRADTKKVIVFEHAFHRAGQKVPDQTRVLFKLALTVTAKIPDKVSISPPLVRLSGEEQLG
jgi:hypothetical protein